MSAVEELASLVIAVDSTSAKTAKAAQDDLTASSVKLEAATGNLKKATDSLGASARSTTADLRQHEQDLKSVAKSTDELAEKRERLKRLSDSGAIFGSTLDESTKALDRQEAAVARLTKTTASHTAAAGLNAGTIRELGVIAGEVARGSTARLEGSLITLANRSGVLASVFTPLGAAIGGAVVVIGGLATAAFKGAEQQSALEKALIATGGAAGLTRGQLESVAQTIGRSTGEYAKANDAVLLLAKSGRVGGDVLEQAASAAVNMSRLTGESVEKTVAELIKLSEDPVRGIEKLNQQYNFLTLAEYEHIKALKEEGNEYGAVAAAIESTSNIHAKRATDMVEQAGTIERAWLAVRRAIGGAVQGALDIGKRTSDETALAEAQTKLNYMLSTKGGFATGDGGFNAGASAKEIAAQQKIVDDLYAKVEKAAFLADEDASKAEHSRNAFAGEGKSTSTEHRFDTQSDKDVRELKEYRAQKDAEILKALDDDNTALASKLGAERDKYLGLIAAAQDKKENRGVGRAEESAEQKNLSLAMAKYADDYKNSMAILQRERQANLVGTADYFQKQHAYLDAERDQQIAAIDAEIIRRQRRTVAGKDDIANRQRIIDLRAQEAKIEADAGAKHREIAAEEVKYNEKVAASIVDYTIALNQKLVAQQNAIELQVAGVGMGKQEYSELQQLNAIDKQFAADAAHLAEQLAKNQISDEQHAAMLALLTSYTKTYRDDTVRGFADMQAAQEDWRNGAMKALKDYIDRARDVAGQTGAVLGGAFTKAEDALLQFTQTGKLNFKSFAVSVLADIERMIIKMELLKVAEMAVNMFGPGGQYGQAIPVASAGPMPSAYGNAFQHGAPVTAFASGGAFTNTIATSPTLAPMALFGEAGPEAIMPLSRGSDGKLGVKAAGSGGGGVVNQVSVSVTIDGNGNAQSSSRADSEAGGKQLGDMVAGVVQQELVRQSRQGGIIWRQLNGR